MYTFVVQKIQGYTLYVKKKKKMKIGHIPTGLKKKAFARALECFANMWRKKEWKKGEETQRKKKYERYESGKVQKEVER